MSDTYENHRRVAHVEAELAWIEALAQLLGHVAVGVIEENLLDGQRRVAPDHLHWLRQALPDDGRAQYVVSRDHPLQRVEKVVEAFARVEGQEHLNEVRIAFRRHQMVEEDAFLERRELSLGTLGAWLTRSGPGALRTALTDDRIAGD